MLLKQRFDISTDTGTQGDTGASFSGSIVQIGWDPTTADTGGDLKIVLRPSRNASTDTGAGWTIYDDNDCLGSDFLRPIVNAAYGPDGLDTGVDEYYPFYGVGDHLRIKVTPGGAAVVGSLYVYVKKDD